jgi:glycerol kinase
MEHPLSIMGGITRNPVLLQRFSDLFGEEITTSTSYETTIQGLLVLCDIAAGKIQSIEDLKKHNQEQQLINTINPRSSMEHVLRDKYSTWQKLFKRYRS